jgi:hypothetical protein
MISDDSQKTGEQLLHFTGRGISSEDIVKLVLLSINVQYQRDADKVERMLAELKRLDQKELLAVFKGLRTASPIEEAIPMLTNWIGAKIEGSNF